MAKDQPSFDSMVVADPKRDDDHEEEETKQDDDRDEEEDDETNPEYELVLQKLEKMDKSSADKFEKGELPLSSLLN